MSTDPNRQNAAHDDELFTKSKHFITHKTKNQNPFFFVSLSN